MNTKSIAIPVAIAVALGLAAAGYYVAYLGRLVTTGHLEGLSVENMMDTYDRAREYRDKTGRWPESLSVVVGETVIDLTSSLPFLYFPDAKPGTEEILLAQPQPFKVGLWPFDEMWRKGVRVDGELVDVRGNERAVVEVK